MFVYSLDESDPIFSHQISILRKLAPHFTSCVVLTFQISPAIGEVPPNVKVVKVCWGSTSKGRRAFNLLYTLFKEINDQKPDVLFSFMTETQSAIAGPFLRLVRIPQIIWYAHRSNSIRYKLAYLFSNLVLTSTLGSVPKVKPKIKVIGQMIDSEKFSFNEALINIDRRDFKMVHVGRLDPSKNIHIICRVFEQIAQNFPRATLHFYGDVTVRYFESLVDLKNEFREAIEGKRIVFHGNLHRDRLPDILASTNFFIHGYAGSLDKSIIEATMIGLPVITSNLEYHKEFGLWNPNSQNSRESADILLSEYEGIKALRESELYINLKKRRDTAVQKHSLEHWTESVLTILQTSKVV